MVPKTKNEKSQRTGITCFKNIKKAHDPKVFNRSGQYRLSSSTTIHRQFHTRWPTISMHTLRTSIIDPTALAQEPSPM